MEPLETYLTKEGWKRDWKKSFRFRDQFREWDEKRVEHNYQEIISQYSSKEQKLIKKGRDVELYDESPEELIKLNRKKYPKLKIVPLTKSHTLPGILSSFTDDGKGIGSVDIPHKPVLYRKVHFGFRCYKDDVAYWLDIGRLGADALCSVCDHGFAFAPFLIGIPVKILRGD